MQGESPPIQTMAKLIKSSPFVSIHRLSLSLKVWLKVSVLGMSKIRVLWFRSRGFPNEEFGRQMGGITEAEHRHSKWVMTTS